jgi:hypothetical protein
LTHINIVHQHLAIKNTLKPYFSFFLAKTPFHGGGEKVAEGRAVGKRIGSGEAHLLELLKVQVYWILIL